MTMMRPHRNMFILLLERVEKTGGEIKEEGDKERGPLSSSGSHLALLSCQPLGLLIQVLDTILTWTRSL